MESRNKIGVTTDNSREINRERKVKREFDESPQNYCHIQYFCHSKFVFQTIDEIGKRSSFSKYKIILHKNLLSFSLSLLTVRIKTSQD